LGVEIETAWRAAAVIARRPDAVVVATGSRPARPYWAPGDDQRIVDVVDVLTGAASPEGRVLVLDELGFHHATSVAELLADRGCQVEVATPGMVVGQDLGITLDLETWWMRAESKGIVQTTELVPMGWDDGTVSFQHHPTGTMVERRVDWLVLAVPPAPAEAGRTCRGRRQRSARRPAGPTLRSSMANASAPPCSQTRREAAAAQTNPEVGSPERAQTVVWAPELRVRAQLRVGARGVGTRVRRRLPDRLG
jgi:hypothetical protein